MKLKSPQRTETLMKENGSNLSRDNQSQKKQWFKSYLKTLERIKNFKGH